MRYFILKGKKAIPCNLLEWSTWFENAPDRSVGDTHINDYWISTVFLGLNHNCYSNQIQKKPHIFETMVFDKNDRDIYCDRYSTWEEAEAGHEKAIQWVKNGCKDEME